MLSEQELIRRSKLQKILDSGVQAYPERYEVTHTLKLARNLDDGIDGVSVSGRIMSIRKMGKLTFASLQDVHSNYQIILKEDHLKESYHFFHDTIDIGDFIGAKGTTFTTKVGEKSLQVKEYVFLGKCLRPLPEKWHGLTDIETRYRQRYIDLMVNEETRHRLLLRSAVIKELRSFLHDLGFIEVETPVLQPNPSGALARPFKTHHNALDFELFLRIAPETYLKRLIVGGFNHVFEVAKCFRNEGISPNHLQEFSMVEGYSAYWSFEDNKQLIRKLFLRIVEKTLGSHQINIAGQVIDLSQNWPSVTFRELLIRDVNIDIEEFKTPELLLAEIRKLNIILDDENPERLGRGNLIDLLYKRVSRPKIIQPTFLTSHPIDLSPLARANDLNPSLTDRFQLVVNGVEVVNAYSELVDPIEQRKRLEQQATFNSQGDQDAMVKDEDYVMSMEFGMPPISGWGFGIERLIQFLTACDNIKDCVLFPISKPKQD